MKLRRIAVALLIAASSLSVVFSSLTVSAQQPPSSTKPPTLAESLKGDARSNYDSAKVLYNDGDYANALLKFSSAYDKSKDPRLLWNMAACEKNLRHYARALRYVRAYAGDTSGLVTDSERNEANDLIHVMEPLTAKLRITVSEPDAEISVDGEVVGVSPLAGPIVVDIGVRKIHVTKGGFVEATKDLPVGGAPEVNAELTLTKVTHEGRVVIKAHEHDAIAIDGKVYGNGSWSGALDSGGHTLHVTARGMRTYQAEMIVIDGQTREIEVTLDPEPAKIPTWAWIAGGAVIASGLAIGGYFLFKPGPEYDGPQGNLFPNVVYTSRSPWLRAR